MKNPTHILKIPIYRYYILAIILSSCAHSNYSAYLVKDNIVYEKSSSAESGLNKIDVADYLSFQSLAVNPHLGKDKNHVYYRWQILIDADPKTFEKIKEYYWKDKDNVYFFGFLESNEFSTKSWEILDVDAPSFSLYNVYGWAHDKNKIYHGHASFKVEKPDNFIPIDENWGKDSNACYFWNYKVESADPRSFVIINPDYAKDKNHVYYMHSIIEGANPQKFKLTGMFEGRDDKYIFKFGKIDRRL